MLKEETLRAKLDTGWTDRQIFCLETVDSTNEEAKRMADKGAGHGTVVVAESQTAGKGRLGRAFVSPKGAGIWMSLVIRDQIRPQNASMLTLVMGLAVARAIESVAGSRPQIKWPNDLILSGRKVCGILTEMSLSMCDINYIIIGVGVNVSNQEFQDELQAIATSIYMESRKLVDREVLLAKILVEFQAAYEIFMKTQDLSGLRDAYQAYLVNRGRQVKVLDPRGTYTGTAIGITGTGELIVETEGQTRQVASGEVSVRGILGYV